MPRHTGRRLNSKARRRIEEVRDLESSVHVLRCQLRSSTADVMKLREENRRLKEGSFTGGKEVTLALRKHYEQNGPRRRMVLSVVLDVESLRSDLYMSPAYFTDGRHIAHKLSRDIEVGLVKLVEDEVLYLKGNTNGN